MAEVKFPRPTAKQKPRTNGALSTYKRPTRARCPALAQGPPALLRVAARYVAASFASREASAPSWPTRQRAPAMPNRCIHSTWFTPFDPSTRTPCVVRIICRSYARPRPGVNVAESKKLQLCLIADIRKREFGVLRIALGKCDIASGECELVHGDLG